MPLKSFVDSVISEVYFSFLEFDCLSLKNEKIFKIRITWTNLWSLQITVKDSTLAKPTYNHPHNYDVQSPQ